MQDTAVHLKAIKNDAARDDDNPNFWSHKFVVRHETPQQLEEVLRKAFEDTIAGGGIFVVKNELVVKSATNLMFIPMHRIARLEVETKLIVGQYDVTPERLS